MSKLSFVSQRSSSGSADKQVIQSYLVNTLRPDAARFQACSERRLLSVLPYFLTFDFSHQNDILRTWMIAG